MSMIDGALKKHRNEYRLKEKLEWSLCDSLEKMPNIISIEVYHKPWKLKVVTGYGRVNFYIKVKDFELFSMETTIPRDYERECGLEM